MRTRLAIVVGLASFAGMLPGEEPRPLPPLAEVSLIRVGTPNGWWLSIRRNGSGSVNFGSGGGDVAAVNGRAFDFPAVYASLAAEVHPEGNMGDSFSIAFLRSNGGATVSQFSDRADIVGALFSTAREHWLPVNKQRFEELWSTQPPVPKK